MKKMSAVERYIKARAKKERGYCVAWFVEDTGLAKSTVYAHISDPDLPWLPAHAKLISLYTKGVLKEADLIGGA